MNKFAVLMVMILILNTSLPVLADEGFWEPDFIPENIKKQYGLTGAAIDKLKQATLKTENGGTAVFVSPNGLVLTNQHVAKDFVQNISNASQNYIRSGFLAQEFGQELKLPEAKLSVMSLQKDVTDLINSKIKAGMPPPQIRNIQIEQSRNIAAKAEKENGLGCEVVSTFGGVKQMLYCYKVYDDIRLVFIPEQEIATFGGDRDNFTFPRYWLDAAFVRIYENNQPLKNNSFISFSTEGVKANDELTVAGFPISTERNLTAAQLRYLQNTEIPLIARRIKAQLASLQTYADLGNAQAVEVQSRIFEQQNSLKAVEGRLQEMRRENVVSKTTDNEKKFFGMIKNDSSKTELTAAVTNLEKAYDEWSKFEAERRFFDEGWAFDTVFFRAAREHVRWANEKAKPTAERLPGFNDELLNRLEGIIKTSVPEKSPNEEAKLTNSLAMMADILGAEHSSVKKVLNNKTPKDRARELLQTKLDNQQFRVELVEKGKAGLDSSTDPMIVLMRWVDERAMRLRGEYQTKFVAVEAVNTPVIAKIINETKAENKYPDANFSLRLSFGKLSGYRENGKTVKPFTSFREFYDKAAANKFAEPYSVSGIWKKNEKTIISSTPFNFALTNDVVGGNSGSPVINKKGELVGLIFDSNNQSLLWKYKYDDAAGRAVAVDVRAINLALKLYGATTLTNEIKGNK